MEHNILEMYRNNAFHIQTSQSSSTNSSPGQSLHVNAESHPNGSHSEDSDRDGFDDSLSHNNKYIRSDNLTNTRTRAVRTISTIDGKFDCLSMTSRLDLTAVLCVFR